MVWVAPAPAEVERVLRAPALQFPPQTYITLPSAAHRGYTISRRPGLPQAREVTSGIHKVSLSLEALADRERGQDQDLGFITTTEPCQAELSV